MHEKIPERLRKLKALAEHPNTPVHEAMLAREMLRRQLAAHGVTESEIAADQSIEWTLNWIEPHERLLFAHVAGMILDTCSPAVRFTKTGKKWQATVSSPLLDKIDIAAAFGWYRAYLREGRASAATEVERKLREIKELNNSIKTLRSAMRRMGDRFIVKHEIYPPSMIAEANAAIAQRQATGSTKFKPGRMTKKQERDLQKRLDAHRAAQRHMPESETWQKGSGLNSSQFELTFS